MITTLFSIHPHVACTMQNHISSYAVSDNVIWQLKRESEGTRVNQGCACPNWNQGFNKSVTSISSSNVDGIFWFIQEASWL